MDRFNQERLTSQWRGGREAGQHKITSCFDHVQFKVLKALTKNLFLVFSTLLSDSIRYKKLSLEIIVIDEGGLYEANYVAEPLKIYKEGGRCA